MQNELSYLGEEVYQDSCDRFESKKRVKKESEDDYDLPF